MAARGFLTSTLPCCALLKPPMANSARPIVSLFRTYMQSMFTSRCIKWIKSPATTKRKSCGAHGRDGEKRKSGRGESGGRRRASKRTDIVGTFVSPLWMPYRIAELSCHWAVPVGVATLLGAMRRHTCKHTSLEEVLPLRGLVADYIGFCARLPLENIFCV